MAIKEITPQQTHDILTADPGAVYIDVRTEREFANGHPAGAVNIPDSEFDKHVDKLPADKATLLRRVM